MPTSLEAGSLLRERGGPLSGDLRLTPIRRESVAPLLSDRWLAYRWQMTGADRVILRVAETWVLTASTPRRQDRPGTEDHAGMGLSPWATASYKPPRSGLVLPS